MEYAKTDNRILYIYKKNEGLGSVRNLGLKLARGEYFTTVDSDDWWDLSFCEKMLYSAQQFDADITICDFMNVEVGRNTILSQTPSRMRITPNCLHSAKMEPSLLNTCRTIFWGKLYKTSFLKVNELNQPHYPFEDMATTPLITVLAEKIVRVPEILHFYLRNRSDSITNLTSTKRYFVQALRLLVLRFRERELFEPFRRELLKKNHSDVRFVISRMPEPAQNEEQHKIHSDLCQFLSSTYPEWVNVEKHTFTVIGSERLQTAVKRFLFHPERAQCFSDIAIAVGSAQGLRADYVFIDCKDGLEQPPVLPKESTLFLIEAVSGYDKIVSDCRVVRLGMSTEAEDEDCACWDLSDAIFFKL